jgi:hypothetical protein
LLARRQRHPSSDALGRSFGFECRQILSHGSLLTLLLVQSISSGALP